MIKTSASNNRFELAVAVPIVNNSFKFPNRFSFTMDAITSTTLSLNDLKTESNDSILYASEVVVAGDRITLQSSAGTSYTTLISSVSPASNTVVVEDDLSSTFTVATTGVGYGTACPGGWYLTNFLADSGYAISIDLGDMDNFSATMYIPEKPSPGADDTFYLKQSIPTDYFVSNLKYRLGVLSKLTVTGSATYTCGVILGMEVEGATQAYSSSYIHGTSSTGVTSFVSTATTVYATMASPIAFGVFVRLDSDTSQATKATKVYVDDIYLEHIYNPVTKKTIYEESPSTASTYASYYEISDNHDSESLTITKSDNYQDITLNDGSLVRYDSTGWGERNVKYEISCRFTNVSTTIWTYLSRLLDIQKNGYKLNLHPYINEVPEVLTGFLYISGISKEHWDVNLVSFDFRFVES